MPVPRTRAIVLAAVKTKPSAALNRAGLDRRCARQLLDQAAGTEECSAGDRGRDGDCSPPPAQTRTGPIKASGSYLEYLTAKRALGQG